VGVVCFLEFQGFKTEGLASLVFKKNCLCQSSERGILDLV
jgi:hypothetical protein